MVTTFTHVALVSAAWAGERVYIGLPLFFCECGLYILDLRRCTTPPYVLKTLDRNSLHLLVFYNLFMRPCSVKTCSLLVCIAPLYTTHTWHVVFEHRDTQSNLPANLSFPSSSVPWSPYVAYQPLSFLICWHRRRYTFLFRTISVPLHDPF